jgi:curved DNA-binding protein CbpA
LEDAGGEVQGYVVRMVGRRPATAVDDIASLIADELGGSVPVPSVRVDPVEAAFGPALTRIRNAPDHFAVLGVSWRDPAEVIRKSYFNLARELHPDRYGAESEEVQRTAAELFDKVRAAWEMLGDDSKREAYIAKVIRGEKTEEEKAMEKVQAILDGEALFKRALNEYYAGRTPQAHELFSAAAERVPDEPEFQAYAGYTTFKLNQGRDERKAEEGAERILAALKVNERLDSAQVLIGLVHRARGDDVSAKRAFTAALKLKPSNPDAARELKRLESRPSPAPAPEAGGGLFSRLFGKKK